MGPIGAPRDNVTLPVPKRTTLQMGSVSRLACVIIVKGFKVAFCSARSVEFDQFEFETSPRGSLGEL